MVKLLDLVIDAHGGMERWQQVERIKATMSMSGTLLTGKGYPAGLRNVEVEVRADAPVCTVRPYDGVEALGRFETNQVCIESVQGDLIDRLMDPRTSFHGHVPTTQWNSLQCLYFVGYAHANYFATPFLFTQPGFEVRELGPHEEGGETWERLLVRFPEGYPTHCREQVFYFTDKGLLRRIDYQVEVAGGGAAAHYCFDHVNCDGLVYPSLRRVVRRRPEGPHFFGPTAVLLHYPEISIINH